MPKEAILVVDDEVIILMAIKQSLRMNFGTAYLYETALSAVTGLEAIERLVSEGVEVVLVISDWLMPGMKGDEFLSIVHSRYPGVKLVMLSGHVDDAQMERLLRDGELLAFLRKPWDAKRLLEIVRQALA